MDTKEYKKSLAAILVCAALTINITAVDPVSVSAEENTIENENVFLPEYTVRLDDIGGNSANILSNSDSGFLFKDQLDENNLNSYAAMEEYLASPSDITFTVKLEENIVLARSSRNISNWSDDEMTEYANAVMSAVMPGIISCTLDYPELFWLNFAEIGCGLTNSGLSYTTGTKSRWNIIISEISIQPNFDTGFTDFNQVLEIRECVAAATDAFEITGETDYEKCLSIYNSIINSTSYDTTAPYAHGVAGVLYDTNAVCEGYAKAFKLLCDREGIPCISILGNYNAEALTAHMWNYVYLDGEWYGCDPTFDESTSDLTYFMKGSDSFNYNHRPESPYSIMTLSFPEISVDDYLPTSETTTTIATTTTTVTTTTTTITTKTTISSQPYTTTYTKCSTTESTNSETTLTSVEEETSSATSETTTTTAETTTTTTITATTTITTTVTEPTSQLSPGDLNGDKKISLLDVIILRKFLINVDADEIILNDRFDFNQDGTVNIFDSAALLRFILN